MTGNGADVQGTLRRFDPATGAGDALLDDGELIVFGGAAFAASGLRLLRIGQRVRLRRDRTGTVTLVTILTLPDPPD